MTLLKAILVGAAAIGVIGAVAIPSARQAVTNVAATITRQVGRIVSPSLEIVHPITAGATSQIEDHGPGRLIDTFSNTDWQAPEDAPTVTITFQEPIDLDAVIIHNGPANGFIDQRRPARLRFSFPDGSSTEIDLVDDHKPHDYDVQAKAIDRVEITVLSTNGPAGTPVSLSEVEFFRIR